VDNLVFPSLMENLLIWN